MFVYVVVNSATLKLYVGQHKGVNLRQYLQQKLSESKQRLSVRSLLYASMRKHPRTVWSIHALCAGLQTRQEVDYWEQFYIKTLKSQHPDIGYNICRGGEGFTGPQSESAKAKISAALIDRPVSEETRAKISASQPRSEKQLAALNQTGVKRTPAQIEKNRANGGKAMRGKKHSAKTLEKMSESAKRRGISPETRQKIKATKKGKPWSPARRAAYEIKTFQTIV